MSILEGRGGNNDRLKTFVYPVSDPDFPFNLKDGHEPEDYLNRINNEKIREGKEPLSGMPVSGR